MRAAASTSPPTGAAYSRRARAKRQQAVGRTAAFGRSQAAPAWRARRHSRRPPLPGRRPGTRLSGGCTRARPRSPWICASSALTPGTSGLPSNSLRIVDRGIERRGIAAAPGARAQVGVEVGGRRDAAGKMRRQRASSSTASVEGNTLKLGRDRRRLARIGHVARGILEADDTRRRMRREQALDQLDVPGQARLAPGSDRDRSGSAWRPSPLRSSSI